MSRRLVVVLFLDLVGWTRLAERVDPEPLQLLLEEFYGICSTAVQDNGGVVEKFIGDAVMAAFGATRSQEDDALRALRAAVRIRSEAGLLSTPGVSPQPPQVHCGLAAGEALVTHTSAAGLRVVGDVVNLAARLQSAAGPGEIVVNDTLARLARRHFSMVPMAPLAVKGKAEPVAALRVTGPVEAPEAAGDDAPMVDRGDERARIRDAYHRMTRDRRSRTLAVSGPPGIGKTRLVRAALAELDRAGAGFRAVSGTCPSYGPQGNHVALAGVLAAVVRQAPAAADLVRANPRVAAVLGSLLDTTPVRGDAARPGPGVEEVSWAARELLAAGSAEPLVVVWDSLEWAGPSLLALLGDLIEGLADRPLLTICVMRPELRAAPQGLGFSALAEGSAAGSSTAWLLELPADDVIDVRGLTPADSAQLAALLTTAGTAGEVQAHDLGVADRAATRSAGNPLFLRLLLESAADRLAGAVPPTITAVVGAMLDRLPEPAADLLGAASVIGSTFAVGELDVLGVPPTDADLNDLQARHLIAPAVPAGRYRFLQQPVHEVAYGRLDKQQRLTWHRLLAARDVSPAFHLAAAAGLMRAIRPHDPDLAPLTRDAARALLGDGTLALRQRDLPTGIELLERALECAPGDGDRAVAAVRLSDALLLAGDTRRAVDVVTRVAQGCSDEHARRACLAQHHLLSIRLGRLPAAAVQRLRHDLTPDPADRLARCRLEQVQMLLDLGHGRFGPAERAALAALDQARAMNDPYEEDRLLVALCEIRQWAPTPITRQLADCAGLARRFAADRFLLVPVLAAQARCRALLDDGAGAHAVLADAAAAVEQLRLSMGRVLIDQTRGLLCSLDGAYAAAERHFGRAADVLDRAGHRRTALTLRVQALRERARQSPDGEVTGELAALAHRAAEMDVRGRLLCLSTLARLGSADPVASPDGVAALLATTDDPCLRGDVLFDLAGVHRRQGDHAAARRRAGAAIDCYAAVGATRLIRTVTAWR